MPDVHRVIGQDGLRQKRTHVRILSEAPDNRATSEYAANER
jgi:hypothetical protein